MEEDKEEGEAEGDRDGETPRGAQVEVVRMGEEVTPRWKMQTSRDSTQNVRTCCFRESMETSRITMMGRTWTEESRTMLYGSVFGSGLLHSQQSGMPRHP